MRIRQAGGLGMKPVEMGRPDDRVAGDSDGAMTSVPSGAGTRVSSTNSLAPYRMG